MHFTSPIKHCAVAATAALAFSVGAHLSFHVVVELLGDFRNHHGIRRFGHVDRVKDDQLIHREVLQRAYRFVGIFRPVHGEQRLHR